MVDEINVGVAERAFLHDEGSFGRKIESGGCIQGRMIVYDECKGI